MVTVTVGKRARELEVRRAQIIDEAIRVIGERGYYGFTIQEVAQKCGLTNGGVIHHFKSKDLLFQSAIDERDRQSAGILHEYVSHETVDAAQRGESLLVVLEVFKALIARSCRDARLTRFELAIRLEAANETHPAHQHYKVRERALLDLWTTMLAPFVAEPRATARLLYALLEGLERQWLSSGERLDVAAEWDRALVHFLPSRRVGEREIKADASQDPLTDLKSRY